MKRIFLIASTIFVLFIMTGCETITDVVGEKAGKAVSSKVTTPTKTVGGIDFKKDEVLCATRDKSLLDNYFLVAKVLTPASAETKNQAEVLYVVSGEKEWTIAVIPSHKASKDELKLGLIVFYNSYCRREDLDEEGYRKWTWYLGRISSTDDLFKDAVEVAGRKALVQWIRIPDEPIE